MHNAWARALRPELLYEGVPLQQLLCVEQPPVPVVFKPSLAAAPEAVTASAVAASAAPDLVTATPEPVASAPEAVTSAPEAVTASPVAASPVVEWGHTHRG